MRNDIIYAALIMLIISAFNWSCATAQATAGKSHPGNSVSDKKPITYMSSSPQETVVRLFEATDRHDWESLAKIFDKKVLLDYSSMSGQAAAELSSDQIISGWKTILTGFRHTHHQVGNFQVSERENKCTVSCKGTATHFLPDSEGDLWTVYGTYDFSLTRDAENKPWMVRGMTFNFKFQSGNTKLPEKAAQNAK